jgi:hypothetical protein
MTGELILEAWLCPLEPFKKDDVAAICSVADDFNGRTMPLTYHGNSGGPLFDQGDTGRLRD